jgi:hypothetical protein
MSPHRQRGQAMTEYLIIGAFCVMAVVVIALGPSPIVELVAAIKTYFSAYSYAISITP